MGIEEVYERLRTAVAAFAESVGYVVAVAHQPSWAAAR